MSNIPTAIFDTVQDIVPVKPKSFMEDVEHAKNFLLSYQHNAVTFRSYRRDVERFLQWCFLKQNKSILKVTRNDIIDFVSFCQNPPKTWVAEKQAKRFIQKGGFKSPNPDWRPFTCDKHGRAGLSNKALQALFAILGSFYTFLAESQVVPVNPVAGVKQKGQFIQTVAEEKVVRKLSDLQWSYVLEVAESMANDDIRHERTLFMMNAFYSLYLRVSELTKRRDWTPMMLHFYRDSDGLWWFKALGKGNLVRQISVSDQMLDALKRYRLSLGLSSLPAPDDKTPLVMSEKTGQSIASTRQIRRLVQAVFDEAVFRLKTDGFNDEAVMLSQATVHWLRHTGISEDVKHRPREHVRDDAGHGSSAITDKYIDVELRARHESAKGKKIKPDL